MCSLFARAVRRVRAEVEVRRHARDAREYDLNGFRRVYLVHIRKTGGTSLNHMLLSLGQPDHRSLYLELAAARGHRLERGGKVFVGWNVRLINRGDYFYAFSHAPLHAVRLPEDTFTVASLRDPVRRVVSHYRMLMEYARNRSDHPCMRTEGAWLGSSFRDFVRAVPKEHLLRQLYTFSASFDVDEAAERAAGLSHRIFVEDFDDGVRVMNERTGLSLEPVHLRKTTVPVDVRRDEMEELRERLAPEYDFLEALDRRVPRTPPPDRSGSDRAA
jgi:hypothetical protein